MVLTTRARPRQRSGAGWRSMVVTADGVHLGHDAGTDAGTAPVLDGGRLLDDIGRLFEAAAALLSAEGGTVVVSRPPGGWQGSPYVADARRDLEAMVADARRAGWDPGEPGRAYETGWFTFRRANSPTLHVAVLPMLDRARTPLWEPDASPAQIAHALAAYHTATGTPFRQTPGVTGCTIVREHFAAVRANGFRRPQPLWRFGDLPDTVATAAGELRWSRSATDAERAAPRVVSFDMRAARLNAAGMVDTLAFGKLRHVQGWHPYSAKTAGLWLVDYHDVMGHPLMSMWGSPRALPVVSEQAVAAGNGRVWVSTPFMRWLDAHGALPLVLDAWVADTGGQYLRCLRDRLRGAVLCPPADDRVRKAVKQTYTQGVGMMATPGGSIDRRDWVAAVLDQERVSVMRGAERVASALGAWPMRCNVDELWYAVEDETTTRAIGELLGDGPELGKWKIKTTSGMADYLERYGS